MAAQMCPEFLAETGASRRLAESKACSARSADSSLIYPKGSGTPLDALSRCQRAWERSQPQLFMELWPDDGLDEPQPSALRFVEPVPAASPYPPSGGGLETRLTAGDPVRFSRGHGTEVETPAPAVSLVLNPGAEPCCDLLGTDGESALFTAASLVDVSAPHTNQTGPGRRSPQGMRDRGQEVRV